jgi:hypothetical protein
MSPSATKMIKARGIARSLMAEDSWELHAFHPCTLIVCVAGFGFSIELWTPLLHRSTYQGANSRSHAHGESTPQHNPQRWTDDCCPAHFCPDHSQQP